MSDALFTKVAFLYVGSSQFEDDLHFYQDVLGARLVWGFDRFGAKVAAFDLGDGPLVLIASHLNSPSTLPILEVDDLEEAVSVLTKQNWQAERGPIEIPNGPCYIFRDPSGNRYGLFQNIRPSAMEVAYRDPQNTHRIL